MDYPKLRVIRKGVLIKEIRLDDYVLPSATTVEVSFHHRDVTRVMIGLLVSGVEEEEATD